MAKRFRNIFESIVYAGMKPNARPAQGAPVSKPGLLARVLSGPSTSDPLYLTNRTWKQKLKSGLVIGVPCVLLAGAMGLGLSHLYAPQSAPPKEPTPAEIVANLLPGLEKTVDLTPREVEIEYLHPETVGSPKLVGSLKNNTDRTVTVEFTADLADIHGSKIDSVTERVEKAPPKTSVSFEFPIDDPEAAIAVVRPGTLRVVN